MNKVKVAKTTNNPGYLCNSTVGRSNEYKSFSAYKEKKAPSLCKMKSLAFGLAVAREHLQLNLRQDLLEGRGEKECVCVRVTHALLTQG